MENILDELKVKLQKELKKKEIIVDAVEYEVKGKYKFLTVTLDKIGGIDLDTIVDATSIVNNVVDKMDIPEENYILDVVSKERG